MTIEARLVALEGMPRLHVTPLARTEVKGDSVQVELDDELERRFRLVFATYQAVRITTADCFIVPGKTAIEPQRVNEVQNSPWIDELTLALKQIDQDGQFMDKARHFLVPAQDEFIEVVAWNITWTWIGGSV